MEGITYEVKGDKLIVTCDLTQPGTLSSTGKTKLISTTRGAVSIHEYTKRPGLKLAVNLTVPA